MYESINMHTYQMEAPDLDSGIRLTVFLCLSSQMSQLHMLAKTEIVFLCLLAILATRTHKIFCKSSYSMEGYTHFIKNATTLHQYWNNSLSLKMTYHAFYFSSFTTWRTMVFMVPFFWWYPAFDGTSFFPYLVFESAMRTRICRYLDI